MITSGFLSYDEALQYARQLYQNESLTERLKPCQNLIISESNLGLIGTHFSYDDYQQFYEKIFVPMKVSTEKLLIIPEDIEQPDIEEIGSPHDEQESGEEEEEGDDDFILPNAGQKKVEVKDFDFGDDFW